MTFADKVNMKADKPEKYLTRLNPQKTISETFSLLRSFISEIIINFDFFISTEIMNRKVLSEEEKDDNYLKLEKEQQRYEQKIRDQIRVEQQLKLHSESIQIKQDDKINLSEELEKSQEEKIEVALFFFKTKKLITKVRSYKKTYKYKRI